MEKCEKSIPYKFNHTVRTIGNSISIFQKYIGISTRCIPSKFLSSLYKRER